MFCYPVLEKNSFSASLKLKKGSLNTENYYLLFCGNKAGGYRQRAEVRLREQKMHGAWKVGDQGGGLTTCSVA